MAKQLNSRLLFPLFLPPSLLPSLLSTLKRLSSSIFRLHMKDRTVMATRKAYELKL